MLVRERGARERAEKLLVEMAKRFGFSDLLHSREPPSATATPRVQRVRPSPRSQSRKGKGTSRGTGSIGGLGTTLEGGEGGRVFVVDVATDGPLGRTDGIRPGDSIVEVRG